MTEEEIGRVDHYFSKATVAAIKMTKGTLKVGDTIHIKGHTTDLTQVVDSIQVDHKALQSVKAGDDAAIKVSDHVRDHDQVFKVTS